MRFIVNRGFVGEVRLSLAAFAGGATCDVCDGRGAIYIAGGGDPEDDPLCRTCSGTGRTPGPGLAAALFAAHPITRVVLTDREPFQEDTRPAWQWYFYPSPRGSHPASDLPTDWAPVAEAVAPTASWRLNGQTDGRYVSFDTREKADNFLSALAVTVGRSVAAGHTHRATCHRCGGDGLTTGPRTHITDRPPIRCSRCKGIGTVTRPGLPPLKIR